MEDLKLSSQHLINLLLPFTQELTYIFCEHNEQNIFLSSRISVALVSSKLKFIRGDENRQKFVLHILQMQLSCVGEMAVFHTKNWGLLCYAIQLLIR
jgi:hypothetical protein